MALSGALVPDEAQRHGKLEARVLSAHIGYGVAHRIDDGHTFDVGAVLHHVGVGADHGAAALAHQPPGPVFLVGGMGQDVFVAPVGECHDVVRPCLPGVVYGFFHVSAFHPQHVRAGGVGADISAVGEVDESDAEAPSPDDQRLVSYAGVAYTERI